MFAVVGERETQMNRRMHSFSRKLRKVSPHTRLIKLRVFWLTTIAVLCALFRSRLLVTRRSVTFSKIGNLGRLGNQLYQVASTIGIAEKHGLGWDFPPEISECSAGKLFQLSGSAKESGRRTKVYEEREVTYYDVNLNSLSADTIDLVGYFQSTRYFNNSLDAVRKYFVFPHERARHILNGFDTLLSPLTATIHVRRTDYLKFSAVYVTLDESYYTQALGLLGDINTVIIVSDDIDWSRNVLAPHLPPNLNIIYSEQSELEDFVLLMLSRKLVIANSTFSWWAAFLKEVFFDVDVLQGFHKIISPITWYNDSGVLSSANEDTDRCRRHWICVPN